MPSARGGTWDHPGPSAPPVSPPHLEGFEVVARNVLVRRTTHHPPGWVAEALARRVGLLLPRDTPISKPRFIDTETTGLSSGAGTTIFLFGIGVIQGGALHLDQFLLEDFPGEPSFLEQILAAIGEDAILVSYNGRAFDWNLFTSRLLMNRRLPPEVKHIDLLYPVRRVYSRALADCRLSTLEAELLGVRRSGDIPGMLIPEAYNRFLRFGEIADMERVVYHHGQDIASLVTVLALLEREATSRLSGAGGDPRTNGAALLRLLIESEAVRHNAAVTSSALTRLAELASAGSADDGAQEAAWYMALHHRRRRETDACVRLFSRLYREFGDLRAGRELAIQLEHRRRDPNAALLVVRELLAIAADPVLRRDLAHRELRLQRKIDSQGGSGNRLPGGPPGGGPSGGGPSSSV